MAFQIFAPHALDSYKLGHRPMYPLGTEMVYSNFTPRSWTHAPIPAHLQTGKIVWVGLQGTLRELKDMWDESFFKRPLAEVVGKFKARVGMFTGEADPDASHLVNLHNLGFLPIHVKALDEGSQVNSNVPTFTIRNTHGKDFAWVTNSLETYLSAESWKVSTNATIARVYRKLLDEYAEKTGSAKEFVDWQGHCFADRGMSGMYDSAKSALGHATSFLGSDSVSGVDYIEYAYPHSSGVISGSVPATEHAVMSLGGSESEVETFRRLIELHPTGVVSIVSDTWDFWNVVTNIALELKDEILGRQVNAFGLAKVVFRPDSGEPADIICGTAHPISEEHLEEILAGNWDGEDMPLIDILSDKYGKEVKDSKDEDEVFLVCNGKYYRRYMECITPEKEVYDEGCTWQEKIIEVEATPAMKGAVECLWEVFGGDITEKGYKTLNQRVGLIYGDSITIERAQDILERLEAKGFSSGNIVFGIGLSMAPLHREVH